MKASSFFLLLRVGGQQLAVSDADTAPDELEFELVEAPIHGELIKTDSGAQSSMISGEMIPLMQLEDEFCKPRYNCRHFLAREPSSVKLQRKHQVRWKYQCCRLSS